MLLGGLFLIRQRRQLPLILNLLRKFPVRLRLSSSRRYPLNLHLNLLHRIVRLLPPCGNCGMHRWRILRRLLLQLLVPRSLRRQLPLKLRYLSPIP
jgi:hypothetical protein